MMTRKKAGAAIIGSGNIGSDLMIKILHHGQSLEMKALVGIDPASDGLARAKKLGVATTADGIDGLLDMPEFRDINIVFDATSASAHIHNNALLQKKGIRVIDLTPAAIGPYVVPVVNIDEHRDAPNLNMVTCGGQATIPVVAAIASVTRVIYAEIVASISSLSAGPGTRANIDEFTETTSQAIETVGGAEKGKAIIILNPAEPPVMMRDTVFCLTPPADQDAISRAVNNIVERVQAYVPGYRLKQNIQFEILPAEDASLYPGLTPEGGLKISVFIEVEGAADYLPSYAGNLDIMTSAALACGEHIAERLIKMEIE